MSDDVNLDLDAIARHLGAERRGPVRAGSGYFGAEQLAAEIQDRFQSPRGGGRATDPSWTERRLIPLSRSTLERLQVVSTRMHVHGVAVSPLQVAGVLLEHALEWVDEEEAPAESSSGSEPSEADVAREALRLIERAAAPTSFHIHAIDSPEGAALPASAISRLRRFLEDLAGSEG